MQQFATILDRVHLACAWGSALIFAATAIGITVNVILRNLVGAPIDGLLDAVQYGLLIATFLGAPWVLSKGAHVSVDLLTGVLPETVARPLARIMALVGAGASAAMVWYGSHATSVSYAKGSMIRSAWAVPEWLTLVLLPMAFVLLTLEFLRQAALPPAAGKTAAGL